MARSHQITIDGNSFPARSGELLLDAALSNGIDLPYDCRSGHCGTCCVRLVSGEVQGGEGSEPGIVHACQCRIVGDAVIEKDQPSGVRTVEGVLSSLRPLSPEVMEVGITTNAALPYHAGQYAQVRFRGYPSRPFSITHPLVTHPLRSSPNSRSVWFHVRRMKDGRVTSSLGKHIRPGHRVKLTGPYGSAHFRPNLDSPLILVATNTGFAPIWSIAVAALRENPERMMMIIAGGRNIESLCLYMGPALTHLARFPNVVVVPVCSTPQTLSKTVKPGRPTDYLPRLLPTDVLYACGAPEMVDSIKSIAARNGAVCYADPFLPTTDDTVEGGVLTRAMGWLAVPTRPRTGQLALDRPRNRREQLILPTTDDMVEERVPTRTTRWLVDRPRNRREQPMLPTIDDTIEESVPTRATRWLVDRPRNRREQPMLPTTDDTIEERVLTRDMGWLAVPTTRQMGQLALDRPRNRREQPILPTTDDAVEESVPTTRWLAVPTSRQMGQLALDRPRNRREQPITDDTVEERDLTRATRGLAMPTEWQMDQLALDRPRNRREQPMQADRWRKQG